ncbi:hypothetical protein [Tepidanaerobacter syntrophicus]|uniref:hypothetical protein n=1 Tax=Tepidanaerobacter syntrophicus TaxID=224999 RepID=UPI001BD3E05B|nr:hypothetical protein [Tepidanaerobacter syntrophicus]
MGVLMYAAMTLAYREFEYDTAKSKLMNIADKLEHWYPKAAASLLEGLEETLIIHDSKFQGCFLRHCAARIPWNQPALLVEVSSVGYPTSGMAR